MLRTHHCAELSKADIGKTVTLCGWVDARRDHGGLLFIDLRDRWGKTQMVFDPTKAKAVHDAANKLRSEYVISVTGQVAARPQGTVNKKIPTGEIELIVSELKLLSESETPPFEILDQMEVSEEIRLRYRFLDIRRHTMMNRLLTRSKITTTVRQYLDGQQFAEIETPYLTKSTPEGARDFLVPSRLTPGTFYALPQSPQLFKQMLMVSGVDRYFQIARCFRDEDLRADRQLEHTQIDIEMSFITEEDIHTLIEGMMAVIFRDVMDQSLNTPFQRLTYADAMNQYGSDKPDLRFGLPLKELTEIFRVTQFKVFQANIASGGVVKGLKVGGKIFSRKELDDFTQVAKDFGAKGLVWLKVKSIASSELESPIAKFLSPDEIKGLIKALELKDGDTAFLVSDEWETTCVVLGELRCRLAKELKLINHESFCFLWIVDFPLLEWNPDEKRWQAKHHPFTSPKEADMTSLRDKPAQARARAYDLVLNGTEIGGGSIRIHSQKVQQEMFKVLGISDEEVQSRFGFFLRALQYGAPPHGGIALGLDRLTAMLLRLESIREVIAFPKTQKGTCLLSEAPSSVADKQLKELHIRIKT
ncbi:MAG: aspartate--tRNA ligase [Candidatus Omnitrophica bacterium CG11_big_fil_rev_8_21_14_0_20_45_26]|uniref:Aspartate--tRNA(Asp/Asn) ligase n=1 Tax=Candidatus Abzuiibacterium crystallinum TaxID=1974748 RepID=A0A2H0LMZ2_9BACT|nr:MAG: aspartate--tRNA ligase [Candidatus Omnitrophica bacterium CG11_big_fil_rev_8_21_14_0_20_45_26]PIW65222.1 MAG: aspartate--tRNA ligase [Candidatus Omnitrophica bacterium CG12_big_fil_rev_8_21_14_0_65_45_16]